MKFTLKDYQRDAVEDTLVQLEAARTVYHRDDKPSSFALTAATGAGKTVMAAAAIEALFYGSDAFDFDADPGAVVIWFSDDPNLNDQTRSRLMEASEKLVSSNLVTIAHPFSERVLEPGKVYFLNTGKLTKSSLLTRGHVVDSDAVALPGMDALPPPDMQGWTIWQTIANTIAEPGTTLYLVLDEAHRGFGTRTTADKATILARLVGGHAGVPPIPVVWGISATIEKYQAVMTAADTANTRRKLPAVGVEPYRVQESGLVKDVVALDIPAEAGNFDSVLVGRAARKLRQSTERWRAYGRAQGSTDVVHPLLVLQSPNTPDPDDLGRALDAVVKEYPELGAEQIRHVLGDHRRQRFGAWEVDWIEPQRVEETAKVRVLIAKDGISTGWDCPRAEVLVSFRTPSKDNLTHVTQLLGRMVRSPLARRVPGDERLNAVDCILPFFDRTTAGNVVRYLTGQIEEMPTGAQRKVLLDARELQTNPAIPDAVWDCWDGLPTLTLPQRGAGPVTRLIALAERLSADGVRPGAVKTAKTEMQRILDSHAMRYPALVEKAIEEVWAVRGQTIAGKRGVTKLAYTDFAERADDRAIRVAFDAAQKAFGATVAQSYVDHLADPDDDDGDDDLLDPYARTSALATVAEIRERVDRDANELARDWFAEHRVDIKGLPDLRQADYETIRAQAVEPQLAELQRPRTRLEDYAVVGNDEQIALAPVLAKHLMADEVGMFPVTGLNDWERAVVAREAGRADCRGWYRNPPRAAVDSLGITYRDAAGDWHSMHPDFVFFHEVQSVIRPSIVDPHGHHLGDARVKLTGLAQFARDYGDRFHRIEAISKIGPVLRVLDLQEPLVRDALIAGKQSPMEYYESDIAMDYSMSTMSNH